MASTDSIDSTGKDACFIRRDTWNGQLNEVAFYYPVAILSGLGVILVLLTGVIIPFRLGLKGLGHQSRLMIYLLFTVTANVWIIFEHFFEESSRGAAYDKTVAKWVACSIVSLRPCRFFDISQYYLDLTTAIVLSSLAIILSLILLVEKEIWICWSLRFQKVILRREIDILGRLGVDGKAIKLQMRQQKGSDQEADSAWGAS